MDKAPKPAEKPKKKEFPIDTVTSTTEMTPEMLADYCWGLWQEAERQRTERDWFQVEKEKIRTFLHIDRMHLMETYNVLRNKDRELCDVLRSQEAEIIQEREKVKAVHMGQAIDIIDGKVALVQKLKIAADEKHGRILQLQSDVEYLQKRIKMGKLAFKEDMKREVVEYNNQMRELLEDLQNKAQCFEKKFDVLLESDRTAMLTELTAQQRDVENKKNKQLLLRRVLVDNVRFDLTQYYNTVTSNNLSLVRSLKNDFANSNAAYERARYLWRKAEKKNRDMKQPLERARCEIKMLTEQLSNVEAVRIAITEKKKELDECMVQKEGTSVELEVLKTRYIKLAQEEGFLRNMLLREALEIQHRQCLKFVMLQERISTVVRMLETSDLLENKIITTYLKDPEMKAEAQKKLQAIMHEKNSAINALKEQLKCALKAHNVLVKTLQIKMDRYGMQDADLGFKTLELYK